MGKKTLPLLPKLVRCGKYPGDDLTPVRGATGEYHMTYGDFVIFTIDMSKEDTPEKLGEFLSKKPVAYRIM